jgi:hypothetical protein
MLLSLDCWGENWTNLATSNNVLHDQTHIVDYTPRSDTLRSPRVLLSTLVSHFHFTVLPSLVRRFLYHLLRASGRAIMMAIIVSPTLGWCFYKIIGLNLPPSTGCVRLQKTIDQRYHKFQGTKEMGDICFDARSTVWPHVLT